MPLPSLSARAAALLRALALGLWAAVLLRSGADGRLALLLRSAFHPLVLLSALALLALALMQGWLALKEEGGGAGSRAPRTADPAARGDGATALATALLAVLLLALPPNPSFADLASQRPTETGSSEELSFVLPPAQRSLTDWVRLLRSQPDPSQFENDPVRISGFVLPQPGGEPPLLARLLVRCCLADATPVGLPVRWPAGAPPTADSWLAIEGTMAIERRSEGPRLVVMPRTIRTIPRPPRPLEP